MTYPSGTFKSSFWETDFVSLQGFETLVTHIKTGQKSCKSLEDYLKQRAKAEEDYGKTLAKISKITFDDTGSLRKVLEKLQLENEVEASLHLFVATKYQEEAGKVEKFRERQKDERKKSEDFLRKTHKFKAEAFRRMQSSRSTYESRFKAAEKAEQEADKSKLNSKQKDVEKARKNVSQTKFSANRADDEYKAAVGALEVARRQWEQDHVTACDTFQNMEEERIQLMRNKIWIFANYVSDLCCKLDDSREAIRLTAEQCDEMADVRDFVFQNVKCRSPLPPIEYSSCDSLGSSAHTSSPVQIEVILPSPKANDSSHVYEFSDDGTQKYIALYAYQPAKEDEIELQEGDVIQHIDTCDENWIMGLNTRTKKNGLFPLSYVTLR